MRRQPLLLASLWVVAALPIFSWGLVSCGLIGTCDDCDGPYHPPIPPTSVVTLASNQANPYAIGVDTTNVYWTNNVLDGSVMKVPIGGGDPTILAQHVPEPCALAVDSSSVYFAAYDTQSANPHGGAYIAKVPISGGGVIVLVRDLRITDALLPPAGLAVDSSNVYFTLESFGSGVYGVSKNSVDLDGKTLPVLYGCSLDNTQNTSPNSTCQLFGWGGAIPWRGMAVDAAKIYWADDKAVWSMSKSGVGPVRLAQDLWYVRTLALYGSTVFFTTSDVVYSVPTSGVGGPTSLVTGVNGAWGIAADASFVYYGVQNGSAPIVKVSLTGGTSGVLASGLGSNNGVACDGQSVYWAASDGSASPTGSILKVPK